MTTQEFSDQFDTLLDSHKFIDDFGKVEGYMRVKLDEYEKSILLTEAQDLLIRENFTPGFDRSEQGQMYFGTLIKLGEGIFDNLGIPYASNGKVYSLPSDIFWILNERIINSEGYNYTVIPINYGEYDRIQSKPYAKPLKRQAWRLYQTALPGAVNPKSEIIMRDSSTIQKYSIRYIKHPSPIILEDLGPNVSIRGSNTKTECELNPIVHFDILSRAVQIALSRYAPVPEEDNTK